MSVMMVMKVKADPRKLEEYSAADPARIRSIAEAAKRHGLTAHRFYACDGQVVVVDEWPDESSFQAFFAEMGDKIRPMFEEIGMSEEPHPEFWRVLDTADQVGWGA